MLTIIAKSPNLFDPIVLFRNYDFSFAVGTARTSTKKLVSGSVYLHDGGFTLKDQTATVTINNLTATQRANLEAMIASRADVLLGTDTAQYSARVASITEPSPSQAAINLLITGKEGDVADIIYPPEPTPVEVGYYYDYLHNSYWNNASNFQGWYYSAPGSPTAPFPDLDVDAGVWADGFTPSKMQFYWNGADTVTNIKIYAATGPVISLVHDEAVSLSSGDVVTGIDYSGHTDLSKIVLTSDGFDAELYRVNLWIAEADPGYTWSEQSTNTEWTVGTGSWDGSKFVADAGTMNLFPTGGWASGYVPKKMRLTFGSAAGTISVACLASGTVAFGNNYEVDAEMPFNLAFLDGFEGDITQLNINSTLAEAFTVTKIEFYS